MEYLNTGPDEAVRAVHALLRRVAVAETQLDILAQEWVGLTHEEKRALGEIAPNLIDVIVRIPWK